MATATAVVQFIRQQSNIGPTGNITYGYNVTFMVGDHGPFTLTFDQAGFTPEKVKAALEAFAANVAAISTPAGS